MLASSAALLEHPSASCVRQVRMPTRLGQLNAQPNHLVLWNRTPQLCIQHVACFRYGQDMKADQEI